MPVTPQEMLDKIVEATTEAKATIRELHEHRAAALDVLKAERARIREAITGAVDAAVADIAENTRDTMRDLARTAVDGIAADLRARLGL